MRQDEHLMSTHEVAAVLAVSAPTVRHLAKKGVIECIRIGRRFRFHPDAVERWIRSGGNLAAAQT